MKCFHRLDKNYVSTVKIGLQRYYEQDFMDPHNVAPSGINMSGEGKLAICIPTYKRADIVGELLDEYMEIYSALGADMYIYDSSEDGFTESVVKEFQKNFSNLFYVKMPSRLHSNMKVYMIFQEYGFRKEYQYVWVCSDSIRWEQNVLDAVAEKLNSSLDMIVVNYRDEEKLGDRYYESPFVFFKECGWHLTLYGAVLLKADTMLKNVNWNELMERYNIPERVNHSHLGFYFEHILELEQFSAVHLSFPTGSLRSSKFKDFSGWRKDTFFVFGYCFPHTIHALPSYYNKAKKTVILKNGKYADILNERNLLTLREDKLFDINIYWEYRSKWRGLTDLPLWKIKKIATMKPKKAKKKRVKGSLWKHVKREWQMLQLKHFVKRYAVIYIYGAGMCAVRYSGYLEKMGVPYAGFVVTHKDENKEELNRHPVFSLDEIDKKDEKTGIILGLNPKNKKEVMEELQKRNIKKGIFDKYIIA